MWVYVETGYYAFNIFFVYLYYKMLTIRRREDFRFMVANCVLNVLNLDQAKARISENNIKGSEAASALNNLFL